MKENLKKVIFLLCFILLVPTVFPAATTNGQLVYEFDYSYNTYHNENAITSTGNFIVSEVTHNVVNGESVYRSDLSLLTDNGVEKFVTLENPQMITYENVVYIYTYNNTTKKLSLYDEQLNLIDTQDISFNNESSEDYYVDIYNEYIVFTARYTDFALGKLSSESIFYNVKNQSFETSFTFPTTFTYIDPAYGIVLSNDYYQVNQVIPFRNLKFKGEPYEALYTNEKLVLITRQQSEQLYHIYQLQTDGTILDTQTISLPTENEDTYLNTILTNDTLKLHWYSYEANTTTMYTYNLTSSNLSAGKTTAGVISNWPVNDAIYVEYDYQNNKEIQTYKKMNGDIIVSFDSYNSADFFTTTTYINEHQLLIKKVNYQTTEASAQLYDLQTSKLITQFTNHLDYSLMNNPDYLYVLDGKRIGNNYQDLKGSLYYIGKGSPIKPTPDPGEPTYASDKMWTVTTSKGIDPAKVTSRHVYVKDANNQLVDVTFSIKDNKLFVYAPASGYQSKHKYTLYIEGLTSTDGDVLKEAQSKVFTIN